MKDASNWGEDIINTLFNEVFEQFLSGATTGSFDYLYNSYDIIAFIALYSRKHRVIDDPKILEDFRLGFDKKMILKIIRD